MAGPSGGEGPVDVRRPGASYAGRLLADTFAITGRIWRPLYGSALAMVALSTGAVCAIVALGFALA